MSEQQPHYSLRWNNHQSHILGAFEALLQASALVDVSLMCTKKTIRAHKVVLSACSPFFQQIFAENPCKHPIIILHEYEEWEIQALVDFMYKGEISIDQEQLSALIKAADSLQIRGLAPQDAPEVSSSHPPTPTSTIIDTPHDDSAGEDDEDGDEDMGAGGSVSKLPHMSHLNFIESLSSSNGGEHCGSPLPRRKQARPRRRSGELTHPQDLSNKGLAAVHHQLLSSGSIDNDDTAEDLCLKKERSLTPPNSPPPGPGSGPNPQQHPPMLQIPPVVQSLPAVTAGNQPIPPQAHHHQQIHPPPPRPPSSSTNHQQSSQPQTHHHHPRLKQETSPERRSPEQQIDLSTTNKHDFHNMPPIPPHLAKEFHGIPPPIPPHPPGIGLASAPHSPIPYPPMPAVTALAISQPHNKFFGLDSPLGLFPPGLDGCRNPLLDLTDHRNAPPESQIFTKKKMGRPKGQHSAPRGGPPRSWTNAELTEALQHVWNKKMTTSQASRIFGIPYNSLLMYVRGKYGKSLKLEQLRKDCTGGPGGPLELLGLGSNNNSPAGKPGSERDLQNLNDLHHPNNNNHPRPPSSESEMMPSPVFNHFPHSFYPDFGSGFPIPVSMLHLLPQADKSRTELFNHIQLEDDAKSDRSKEMSADEESDIYRPPILSSRDDCRRELLQQNGQE